MLSTGTLPADHRAHCLEHRAVIEGAVRFDPAKTVWMGGCFLGTIVGGTLTFTWAAFVLFFAVTAAVLLFGHSIGNHRKLVHHSFNCPRWLERTLLYFGVQVGLDGPLGLLRQHELRDFAQRLPACHPYLRHGSSIWRDAWWQLCCRLELDSPPHVEIEPELLADRYIGFLEKTWMLQQVPPALLFYCIGGWPFVFWGVCARILVCVTGHWLIGYCAHNQGQRTYHVRGAAVQGHNLPWAALITMGEAWHNNHHAYPGSAKLGLAKGEWDPGWWVIAALKRLGLAWDIRLPSDLPGRPELQNLTHPAE